MHHQRLSDAGDVGARAAAARCGAARDFAIARPANGWRHLGRSSRLPPRRGCMLPPRQIVAIRFEVGPLAVRRRKARAKGDFPMRNRTMALISDATVIIEAGDTSGSLSERWERAFQPMRTKRRAQADGNIWRSAGDARHRAVPDRGPGRETGSRVSRFSWCCDEPIRHRRR